MDERDPFNDFVEKSAIITLVRLDTTLLPSPLTLSVIQNNHVSKCLFIFSLECLGFYSNLIELWLSSYRVLYIIMKPLASETFLPI